MARPDKVHEIIPVLRRFVLHFSSQFREQRVLVSGSFVAIFAEVFLRLLEPWPLAIVIDHVLGLGREGGGVGLGALRELEPTTLLTVACVLLVVVAALRGVAAYVSAVGFALAGNRLLTQARNALYRRLQELSLSFHTKSRNGDLVLRVIGDVGMVKEVVVTAMLPLLANLLILLGMLGVMFWMQWELTLVAMVTVPLFWLSTVRLGRRIRVVARNQRRREGNLATHASETLSGIQTMKALSLDKEFARAFDAQSEGSMREGVQAKRLSARLERTVDVLSALATALVMFFGAKVVMSGGLSPGELVVFLTYLKSGFRPVRNFAKYTARLAKASAAAERVLEVLERDPEVTDLPGACEAPALRGSVRFDNASFGYGSAGNVLRDVDFSIEPGERVAIIGASGAGKSTMMGAILRLHDPREGQVLIDDEDIRSFTLDSLRRQVCIVLQDTMVFAATIKENIAFGAPGATDEDIEAAAHLANAHEFIARLPDGYDEMIGERGLDLSTGQRQRLAIARAAVSRSPIVILDEPLVGLDDDNARDVSLALDRLAEGRTTFLITHDVFDAARCDRVILLDGGSVAEFGTHAALLEKGGRYAELFAAASEAGRARGAEELHAVGS